MENVKFDFGVTKMMVSSCCQECFRTYKVGDNVCLKCHKTCNLVVPGYEIKQRLENIALCNRKKFEKLKLFGLGVRIIYKGSGRDYDFYHVQGGGYDEYIERPRYRGHDEKTILSELQS